MREASVIELRRRGIRLTMRIPGACPDAEFARIMRQAETLMNMVANVNAGRPATEFQDIVEQIDVKREVSR